MSKTATTRLSYINYCSAIRRTRNLEGKRKWETSTIRLLQKYRSILEKKILFLKNEQYKW